MTPTEAEKEFEEWISPIRNKMLIKEDSFYWAKQAYFKAHSRQQKEIDRLREGIKRIIQFPLLDDDGQHITAMWRELQKLLREGKDE